MISPLGASTLIKLESLSAQGTRCNIFSKIVQIVLRILKCFGIRMDAYRKNQVRSNDALRTQEHLLTGGSNIGLQRNAFIALLSKKKGENFERLKSEMMDMLERKKAVNTSWGCRVQKQLEKLQKGASMWVDCKSFTHAMLMRITKEDEGYTVHFVNTGGGLKKHPELHPRVENYFQTVAEFRNVPQGILSKDFFDRIERAGGSKDVDQIEAVYKEISVLGIPEKIPFDKKSPYWSEPQLGGSCAPSSMWAMARIVLTPQEHQELVEESKWKSLKRTYKSIKNGWDRSATAKIMVLDQVQTLKGICKPAIFNTIENELLNDLKMHAPEVVISKESRKSPLLSPVLGLRDQFTIMPTKNSLKGKEYSLKAKVTRERLLSPIRYTVSKENDQLKGKDALDSMYLLYHSATNGDHEMTSRYLNHVLEDFPSLNVSQEDKINQTAVFFASFAEDSIKIDKTRSGAAKALFFGNLSSKLLFLTMRKSKELESTLRVIDMTYHSLNTEFLLPKDNIWLSCINKIIK